MKTLPLRNCFICKFRKARLQPRRLRTVEFLERKELALFRGRALKRQSLQSFSSREGYQFIRRETVSDKYIDNYISLADLAPCWTSELVVRDSFRDSEIILKSRILFGIRVDKYSVIVVEIKNQRNPGSEQLVRFCCLYYYIQPDSKDLSEKLNREIDTFMMAPDISQIKKKAE
jgi:hypothetical protein